MQTRLRFANHWGLKVSLSKSAIIFMCRH
jgi:hypothetical protein